MENPTPEKYLARAEQIRHEAQTVEDAEHKRVLLFIAGNYERLAQSIEGQWRCRII
jgi:hypothetical protein